jgi:hypothetical protein
MRKKFRTGSAGVPPARLQTPRTVPSPSPCLSGERAGVRGFRLKIRGVNISPPNGSHQNCPSLLIAPPLAGAIDTHNPVA